MQIDPMFFQNLRKHGEHNGHAVWGDVSVPKKLGIHGTRVAVNQDTCNGDGVCLAVCPANVFDIIQTPGHGLSEKKSDPARESDCVFCMACEVQCPRQCIRVTRINRNDVYLDTILARR
jgi:NAD-dependent dihydropyrimidine dehydrogenase PreA subunit